MIATQHIRRVPQRIQGRLEQLHRAVEAIMAKAKSEFKTEIPRRVAFSMTSASTSGDLLTEYERALSVSFVTRYDHLPDDLTVHLVEHNGQWQINNFWELRHVLNDFRPIIQNQETPFTTPECIAYGVGCFCAPIQRQVWWCASLADTGN